MHCHGLSVCTAITYQTEDEFEAVDWLSDHQILKQVEVLAKRYPISGVKFGLIPSPKLILKVVTLFQELKQNPVFVWDPILKASTGFDFQHNTEELDNILEAIDLVTPNQPEFDVLFKDKSSFPCSVLLKGGHAKDEKQSTDTLIEKDNTQHPINSPRINYDKHGTGCVLSSAILGYKCLGADWLTACKKGKDYINNFLKSDDSLLGFH